MINKKIIPILMSMMVGASACNNNYSVVQDDYSVVEKKEAGQKTKKDSLVDRAVDVVQKILDYMERGKESCKLMVTRRYAMCARNSEKGTSPTRWSLTDIVDRPYPSRNVIMDINYHTIDGIAVLCDEHQPPLWTVAVHQQRDNRGELTLEAYYLAVLSKQEGYELAEALVRLAKYNIMARAFVLGQEPKIPLLDIKLGCEPPKPNPPIKRTYVEEKKMKERKYLPQVDNPFRELK